MSKYISLPLISLSLLFFSCYPDKGDVKGEVEAYVPVYSTMTDIHDIKVEEKKPTLQAGKIYAYQNYILQNDLFTGIHIIDNKDRNHPVKIAFLNLPLSTEIAIKDNYLYTNNYLDLVVFDISNPANPKLVKRVENMFPVSVDQKHPPILNAYFQCPDSSKGVIVKWEKKTIPRPDCRR